MKKLFKKIILILIKSINFFLNPIINLITEIGFEKNMFQIQKKNGISFLVTQIK